MVLPWWVWFFLLVAVALFLGYWWYPRNKKTKPPVRKSSQLTTQVKPDDDSDADLFMKATSQYTPQHKPGTVMPGELDAKKKPHSKSRRYRQKKSKTKFEHEYEDKFEPFEKLVNDIVLQQAVDETRGDQIGAKLIRKAKAEMRRKADEEFARERARTQRYEHEQRVQADRYEAYMKIQANQDLTAQQKALLSASFTGNHFEQEAALMAEEAAFRAAEAALMVQDDHEQSIIMALQHATVDKSGIGGGHI